MNKMYSDKLLEGFIILFQPPPAAIIAVVSYLIWNGQFLSIQTLIADVVLGAAGMGRNSDFISWALAERAHLHGNGPICGGLPQ